MKNHNIHPVFHALLLRIHIPNNDRLFPRREVRQVTRLSDENQEWTVDLIETHAGKGRTTLFKVLWKSGDYTQLLYNKIEHFETLKEYLDTSGFESIDELTLGKGKLDTDNSQISISLVKHEATFQTHCYSMNTQADPLKTLSYYAYSYYKPLIMSTTHKTTTYNFVSAFLQGTNMSQPLLQLLVGLRVQLVTQDQVTHDYSTTTDYVFDCKELKEIATFSRAIHNNSLDTTIQLSECYLIVLHLYNFYILLYTRLSTLLLF